MTVPGKRTVFLIVPPVGDSTMPMMGPHALAGYLKKQDIPCRVCDISIELLHAAADPLNLRALAADSENGADDSYWLPVIDSGLLAMDACSDPLHSLAAGLKLYSLLVGRFAIGFDEVTIQQPMPKQSDLLGHMRRVEPLIALFQKSDAFRWIIQTPDSVIGLSVAFQSQLLVALALARAIKSARPSCTVVFGGTYFNGIDCTLEKLLRSWSFSDLLVRGPGELVLEALAMRSPIESVKGADHIGDGRFVVDAQKCMRPSPDFSDVPWHLYTSDRLKVVPFSFYTACHYSRCRFCSGDRGTPVTGAEHPHIQDGIRALISMAEAGIVDCVYIVDAGLPPKLLQGVAEAVGGKLRWAANARPVASLNDPDLLRFLQKGGCDMLRLGFESGSQRVLNMMRKGTHIDIVSDLVKNVAAAGIKNHLYILLGYPGEDASDRENTVQFLKEHRESIHSYSVSVFQAMPSTEIYNSLCDRLGLDKEQIEEARLSISAYLFPDEKSFADIRETINNISRLLRSTSKGNRFYYSGRVFDDKETIKQCTPTFDLLGPFKLSSTVACGRPNFASVVRIISTGAPKTVTVSTFVDLVNDELIFVEKDIGEITTFIANELRKYCVHRDIERLSRELSPEYEVKTVGWNGHLDNVTQNSGSMWG